MAAPRTNNPNVVLNQAGRGSGLRNRASEALLHFPAASDKLGMGMLLAFKKFNYNGGPGSKAKIATDVTQAHIALPLPENLVDSIGINYETSDLGIAGLAYKEGHRTGKALKDFMSKQDSEAEGKDVGGPDVAGTTEYVLRSMAQVSGALGGVLNLAAGNVPNPFQTAIFKNVEIRQHNFTFRLTPETPEDSVMIAKIISELKFHALPGGTAGSAFLTMPDEVDVMFFGTNALYGFARCVIKRVQVNYAPQNVPSFFKNVQESNLIGAPQAVELQIELSEIEQLTKASYQSEFDSLNNLSGPQSPEGAESVPSAEQPGNKLRSEEQGVVSPTTSNPAEKFTGGPPASRDEGADQKTFATTARSSNTVVRQTQYSGQINGPYQTVYANEIAAERTRLGYDTASPIKRRIIEAQAKSNISAKLINGSLAPRGGVTVTNVSTSG